MYSLHRMFEICISKWIRESCKDLRERG